MPFELRPDCEVDGVLVDLFAVDALLDELALLLDVVARLEPEPLLLCEVDGREPP